MLLTVDQAGDRLGTTPRFIRRSRAERRIAVVKLRQAHPHRHQRSRRLHRSQPQEPDHCSA
jgi:hypothetical protein